MSSMSLIVASSSPAWSATETSDELLRDHLSRDEVSRATKKATVSLDG